jgi:hypothetical protein
MKGGGGAGDDIQVLGVLAPSIQTVGPLLRNPWPAKPAGKNWTKVSLLNLL